MLRDTLRLGAALALLGAAAIAAFFLSRAGNPLPGGTRPQAATATAPVQGAESSLPGGTRPQAATAPVQGAGSSLPDPAPGAADLTGTPYVADVEGWYQITPQERAVISRFDLGLASLPGSLPMQIGPWSGSTLPPSPDIAKWFDNPEVSIERQYVNPAGDVMWLAVFGSAGNKSYHLFEHTPQTCYPGTGWNIVRQDVERIPIGAASTQDGTGAAIYAQHGVAEKDGQRLIVLYWYLWDNFERDASRGVLSFRLTAPILKDEAATLQVMKADFLSLIFTRVLDWRRF